MFKQIDIHFLHLSNILRLKIKRLACNFRVRFVYLKFEYYFFHSSFVGTNIYFLLQCSSLRSIFLCLVRFDSLIFSRCMIHG